MRVFFKKWFHKYEFRLFFIYFRACCACILSCLLVSNNVIAGDLYVSKKSVSDKIKSKFIGYASLGPLSESIKSNSTLLQAISPNVCTVLTTMTSFVGGSELPGVSKKDNFCVFFAPLDNKSISFVCLVNADNDSSLIKFVTQFNGVGVFIKKLISNWYIISDDKISLETAYNNSNELIDIASLENDGVVKLNFFESLWNGQFQFLLPLLKKHELFLLIEEILKNFDSLGIDFIVDGEEITTDLYIAAKNNFETKQQLGGQIGSSKWTNNTANMNCYGSINLNDLQNFLNYLMCSFAKFFENNKTNNFLILKAFTNSWCEFNSIFSTISKTCTCEFSSYSNFLFKGVNLTFDYVSIFSGTLKNEEFLVMLRSLFTKTFPGFFKKLEEFSNQQIKANCSFFENVFSSEGISVHELDLLIKTQNNSFICNQKSFLSIVNGNILITDDKTSATNYIRAILGNKTLSTPGVLSIGQLFNLTIDAETFLSLFGKKYQNNCSKVIKLSLFLKNNKFCVKINSNINTIKELINIKN